MKIFESCDYSADVDSGWTSIFDCGEPVFRVKYEIESKEELEGLVQAYKLGLSRGERAGRAEAIAALHELLGIDRLVEAIENHE